MTEPNGLKDLIQLLVAKQWTEALIWLDEHEDFGFADWIDDRSRNQLFGLLKVQICIKSMRLKLAVDIMIEHTEEQDPGLIILQLGKDEIDNNKEKQNKVLADMLQREIDETLPTLLDSLIIRMPSHQREFKKLRQLWSSKLRSRNKAELKHAVHLMETEQWERAVVELERLEHHDWSDKLSPEGFRTMVLGLKAESLVKLGRLDKAIPILLKAIGEDDPGGMSLYLAKLALENNIKEYYSFCAEHIERMINSRMPGLIAN